jgi:hypothetical protein
VDVLVQRAPVESAMGKVMEHVLKHEEEGDLGGHEGQWSEGNLVCCHAEVAADRVEEVDQREFAGEVGEENDLCALPDLSIGNGLALQT